MGYKVINLKDIYNTIGETKTKERLKEFYESNGFEYFGKRNLEKDERDTNSGDYLLQMIRDLSKYSLD